MSLLRPFSSNAKNISLYIAIIILIIGAAMAYPIYYLVNKNNSSSTSNSPIIPAQPIIPALPIIPAQPKIPIQQRITDQTISIPPGFDIQNYNILNLNNITLHNNRIYKLDFYINGIGTSMKNNIPDLPNNFLISLTVLNNDDGLIGNVVYDNGNQFGNGKSSFGGYILFVTGSKFINSVKNLNIMIGGSKPIQVDYPSGVFQYSLYQLNSTN